MRKEKCPYAWTIPMDKIKDFATTQHYTLVDQISYEKLQERDTPLNKQVCKRLIEDIHIAIT
jgi:hypothetical protein